MQEYWNEYNKFIIPIGKKGAVSPFISKYGTVLFPLTIQRNYGGTETIKKYIKLLIIILLH